MPVCSGITSVRGADGVSDADVGTEGVEVTNDVCELELDAEGVWGSLDEQLLIAATTVTAMTAATTQRRRADLGRCVSREGRGRAVDRRSVEPMASLLRVN